MNRSFSLNLIVLMFIVFVLSNCTKIRESAGVSRKTPDEYTIVEDPPLAIPPDYNLLPSEEIIAKKKSESNAELTKEILFGLNEENNPDNKANLSVLDSILQQSGAQDTPDNIREDIDLYFAKTSSTKGVSWEKYTTEQEVLDAVKESQRIRENIFNKKSILEGDSPITTRPIEDQDSFIKRLF